MGSNHGATAGPAIGYGHGPRMRDFYDQGREAPIVLKECRRCGDLVDRETLFAGNCPKCPPGVTIEKEHEEAAAK